MQATLLYRCFHLSKKAVGFVIVKGVRVKFNLDKMVIKFSGPGERS